jgi:hypothetical protein
LQRRHSAMRFQKQSGDSGLLLIPISNLHPRGFAVSSIHPETSALHHRIYRGWSRFCARARALARHPLQMFVCPERWGDFPQTRRPVSRPSSLALTFNQYIILFVYNFLVIIRIEEKKFYILLLFFLASLYSILFRYLSEININIYVNRVLHNEGLVAVKNLQEIVVAL